MTARPRPIAAWLCLLSWPCIVSVADAQDPPLIVRPGPTPHEDFETDADGDQIPDGWYNLRDARLDRSGGFDGPSCLTFECARRGRPARASRAFGVDGGRQRALTLSLWVRIEQVGLGERIGDDAGLILDLLDSDLRAVGRASLGPWTSGTHDDAKWFYVSKRIPVPTSCRDAILSVGLLGSTGKMSIDGMRIDLEPIEPQASTNLVLNGGAELGDRDADRWNLNGGARRVSGGHESAAAIELARSGAQAQAVLAVPISEFNELAIACQARASGLRGSGGAECVVYYVDQFGKPLGGSGGAARAFRFSGSFAWTQQSARVRVPANAARAVVQFQKLDNTGTLVVDDLVVTTSPDPQRGRWSPHTVTTDTASWHPYEPAEAIELDSALDASKIGGRVPIGKAFVSASQGHFKFDANQPARFFGAVVLPPLAVIEPEHADALADNLSRRGVNLVRFDDLDAPLGVARSLLDDTADDTITLDPDALARFDHLVAALTQRGIFISICLNGARRVRDGDGVAGAAMLPAGGGPAVAFDPKFAHVIAQFADALLGHVNPETGRALRDDPALAWVTISGEQSLFNLIETPDILPRTSTDVLNLLAGKAKPSAGRPMWQRVESEQWTTIARQLRQQGVRAPIAGCAHWRDETEFIAAQSVTGLDLIDDRQYIAPNPIAMHDRRGLMWDRKGGVTALASAKRRGSRAYAVSQWCEYTDGQWALEQEAASMLLTAAQARDNDWDALVRRGVFLHPEVWGAAAPGTGGGDDVFPIPEVINANPAVFAMMPHAASLFLRRDVHAAEDKSHRRSFVWDPATGRLVVDTAHTAALAVNTDRRAASFENLTIECATPGGCVAVSALGAEPIATARRLLVTAIARIEPTGLTYADPCRTAVSDRGRPPLLAEPVRAVINWKPSSGAVRAYALDSAGRRVGPPISGGSASASLELDGSRPGIHWELVRE